ncbi:uncharacterized protein [Watersipora subatra]|uniref:uncharacterized protein n=1 Tax=Watersipora subatra TaxID=2589382 RepID=UPI00355BA0DA
MLLAKRRNIRRDSKAIKVDLEKLKSGASASQPFLTLLINNSKNNYIDVIENPFDTGVIPPQTRSRLLLEAKTDDTMYRWLGFTSKTQLEKALKENPRSIKKLPTALLAMVEEDEDPVDLDKEQFSDSDSEKDDDEDIRFKIFDKKKFKPDSQ